MVKERVSEEIEPDKPESKIIYEIEPGQIRVLRGRLGEDGDDNFITLIRSDGTFRIAKKSVLIIQEI